MRRITDRIGIIDVEHLGNACVIGACVLEGRGGYALLDPGPASTLETLLAALERHGLPLEALETVVVTHIHLDHAGATGHLAERCPDLAVYVHERGAAHLVDPSRLVRSARRLWGAGLDDLWGEPLPVPQERVRTLSGGERIEIGGHTLEVEDSPGHASHHLCFFDLASGTAFVGDTAGVRMDGLPFVAPPTPPPDIDIEAWGRSLDRIASWAPERLVLTHFGVAEGVAEHLGELRSRLAIWAEWVRTRLAAEPQADAANEQAFAAMVEAEVRAALPVAMAEAMLQASPPPLSWLGLARYWRRSAPGA